MNREKFSNYLQRDDRYFSWKFFGLTWLTLLSYQLIMNIATQDTLFNQFGNNFWVALLVTWAWTSQLKGNVLINWHSARKFLLILLAIWFVTQAYYHSDQIIDGWRAAQSAGFY